MYQPNKRSREQTTLPYFKKKKKKTWKEKLETSVRQVNLQNEETVDNKGLRPRHKADQISNNTLNFPLCDPSPPPPPPSVPLNSNIQINQSSSGVPCTFPAQRFQLSKPPSLQLLISLSPSLHLLVVFLPYTRPSSLVLITLMSPGINFWARTRNPGARLYFRGIWSIRHDALSSPRFSFFLSLPPPFLPGLIEKAVEKLSEIHSKRIVRFQNFYIRFLGRGENRINMVSNLWYFRLFRERRRWINKFFQENRIFSTTWRGLIDKFFRSY